MADSGKSKRILDIQQRLIDGEVLNKSKLASEYGADPRSIQRDIDEIRAFYADRTASGNSICEVAYDRKLKGFRLVEKNSNALTDAEIFALMKILLCSRSLSRSEVRDIIEKLLELNLLPSEKKVMKGLIDNELFNYVEPRHHKQLSSTVWELGNLIHQHRVIELRYKKSSGAETSARVKPLAVLVSEYYFYLIAYIGDADKEHTGYPTIYRIDRILSYTAADETFYIPYKDRFEEGEFRNKIPFMYSGKLQKRSFIYKGPDIDAVLDRLPTAKAVKQKDGSYRVTAEVYGDMGLSMWLRSQGEYVEY